VALAVPEWVRAQLLPGETVLAKASCGSADYFATDRRLLVFRSKSNPGVLDYRGVSVRFHRYGWFSHVGRLLTGVWGLAFVGLTLLLIRGAEIGETTVEPRADLAAVCAAQAALWLVVAIVSRYGYYVVAAGDETPTENARRAGWRYRLERLRFAPRNAELGRIMRVVQDMARHEWGAGEEAAANRRSGPGAPVMLASVTGALVGGTLMTLCVMAADAAPSLHTEGRYHIDFHLLMVLPAAIGCAVVAGFAAGLFANWRGATAGNQAATMVFCGALLWLFYTILWRMSEGESHARAHFTFLEWHYSDLLDVIAPCAVALVVALALGALAGWVSERLRG
jgi:hypothetical protein